jgi:hypothetical protein
VLQNIVRKENMGVKLFAVVAAITVLGGCASQLPAQLKDVPVRQSATKYVYFNYSEVGNWDRHETEELLVYRVKPVPSVYGSKSLLDVLDEHCTSRGGTRGASGPILFPGYGHFNVCQDSDQPLFFYHIGTEPDSNGESANMIAEKQPAYPDERFIEYLNERGYLTPAQERAERKRAEAEIAQQRQREQEDHQKVMARVEPLYREAREIEEHRLKSASRGARVCRLVFKHYPAELHDGPYTIHVTRYTQGYLEEHGEERMKVLKDPQPGVGQAVMWTDYKGWGLCTPP